jgi:WD40 repeat protein
MIAAGLKAVVFTGASVACLGIFDLADSEITLDPRELEPGLIEQYRLGQQVWSLAFSADGRYLASATITGEVAVKALMNGRTSRLQRGPISSVRALAFSPVGHVLAFTSGGSNIRFWDAGSQRELDSLETGGRPDGRLAFSRDGVMLAVGEWVGTSRRRVVSVWDWKIGRRLALLNVDRGGINALAFSADSKNLAVGDSSGTVTIWDTTRWWTIASYPAHTPGHGGVSSLAFSPSGGAIATAGFLEPIVRIWDPATSKMVATLKPTGHVNAVGFSPDGTLLATAQADGSIGLWDLAERRLLGSIPALGKGIHTIAFSADGHLLAAGDFGGIVSLWEFWRAIGRGPLSERPGHESELQFPVKSALRD